MKAPEKKVYGMLEKMFSDVYEACENAAESFDSKSVPLALLKTFQDTYLKKLKEEWNK